MNLNKKTPTRNGFGDEIVALGKENKNILVVDADIGKSCKTGDFRKQLPDQYLNVGIAEQNCAGVAAGLATCGKIPFVVTYAAFGSMRMCEMIRQEIAYPKLNVKIACSHGGVTPANDGASHQAIEDMGILRTIPNMTVVMPADYASARKLVRAAAEFDGPVYLRFTRDAVPVIYDEGERRVQDRQGQAPAPGQGRRHHRKRRHRASGPPGGGGPGRRGHRGPRGGHAHHQAPGRRLCHGLHR